MKEKMTKKVIKMVATAVASSGPYEWPPSCIFFTYQPMRPNQKDVHCNNTNTPVSKEDN